ncbi:MAG: riboflavin kinase, partial [Chlamydiota bacterium]|nr:riboflavin kinase [Chlamydiota bacterium]
LMIRGKIKKGNGLGRKMGFPTLNIPYYGDDAGVFVGRVLIDDEWHIAAVHIGPRLTIDDDESICEAFLLDWKGGKIKGEIQIELGKKIRDTKKFDSMELLKNQITEDVEFVKNWYN